MKLRYMILWLLLILVGAICGMIVFSSLLLSGYFEEDLGPTTVGILRANSPLQTPISQQPACAVQLTWGGRNGLISDRLYSHTTTTHYSSDATIEIDQKRYVIVGRGGRAGEKIAGDTWNWRWTLSDEGYQVPVTPPETLYGWDDSLDRLLKSIEAGNVDDAVNLSVRERYIPCGERIGIVGEIVGDEFHVSSR